ncbi:MAG TPA: glycoside hydrolase family 99-like domain-containing protein [Chthoniobacterales bacterium]
MHGPNRLELAKERLTPRHGLSPDVESEHLQRYLTAAQLVDGLCVLDAGSGAGYGSHILAEKAASVVGIDVATDAVDFANAHYSIPHRCKFQMAQVEALPFKDGTFDAAVTFETIEYLDEAGQRQFFSEIYRVLKPTGLLILSTPDKHTYSDLPGTKNPYHLRELLENDLRELLSPFQIFDFERQGQLILTTIWRDETKALPLLKTPNVESQDALYFVVVAGREQAVRPQKSLSSVYYHPDLSARSLMGRAPILGPHIRQMTRLQVFFAEPDQPFSEEASVRKEVAEGAWCCLEIPVPRNTNLIRIDPTERLALAEIRALKLDDTDLLERRSEFRYDGCEPISDRILYVLCTSDDPCFILPPLPPASDGRSVLRLELRFSIQSEHSIRALEPFMSRIPDSETSAVCHAEDHEAAQRLGHEVGSLRRELELKGEITAKLDAENRRNQTEKAALEEMVTQSQLENSIQAQEIARHDSEILRLRKKLSSKSRDINSMKEALQSAIDWQRRSWMTRAFHRWRLPGSKKPGGQMARWINSIVRRVSRRKSADLGEPIAIESEYPATIVRTQIHESGKKIKMEFRVTLPCGRKNPRVRLKTLDAVFKPLKKPFLQRQEWPASAPRYDFLFSLPVPKRPDRWVLELQEDDGQWSRIAFWQFRGIKDGALQIEPAPVDWKEEVCFHIERPDSSEAITNTVRLGGWLAPRRLTGDIKLRALVDGKRFDITYGSLRRDLAEFDLDGATVSAQKSGFELDIPLKEGSNWIRLQIEKSNTWHDLTAFEIHKTSPLLSNSGSRDSGRVTKARDALEKLPPDIDFALVLDITKMPSRALPSVLESVIRQVYPRWHLWILLEGHCDNQVLLTVAEFTAKDARIEVLKACWQENSVNFPPLPDTSHTRLAYLTEETPMPVDWLVEWFLEIHQHPPLRCSYRKDSFAARRFVRDADVPQPSTKVRAIAMYLPQFHAIPENDEWWGTGFTEWANVRRAFPLFPGHDQPRVPHVDIGYYDLLDPAVRERQASMAREYGLHGFCYYMYWFNGKLLLEKPLEALLESGKPDFPFCLCWANENWSRRWDGREKEVLIGQQHSAADDEAFIRHVIHYFRDSRYIRVNGRPLLLTYRPGLFPNPRETFALWRAVCRKEGIGEIYLAAMRAFNFDDPKTTGLDALIQFPPLGFGDLHYTLRDPEAVNAIKDFSGNLYQYDDFARSYIRDPAKTFKLFRGVIPQWDNTPRRLQSSSVFTKSSPAKYFQWLRAATLQTMSQFEGEEQLLFINAWNEWGEGCYLEPDLRQGYVHLETTRHALRLSIPAGWKEEVAPKMEVATDITVLIISHDACRNGAQMALLTILREWTRTRPFHFKLILVKDGALRSEFDTLCPTLALSDFTDPERRGIELVRFASPVPGVIYSNTVVNGPTLASLRFLDCPVVTHVHELQASIERWAPRGIMAATVKCTDHFIAVSSPVARNLRETHQIASEAITTIYPSIDLEVDVDPDIGAEFDFSSTDIVVFGCGTMDWRKGPDLFVQIADKTRNNPNLRFIWIGGGTKAERETITNMIRVAGLEGTVRFLGEKANPRAYFSLGKIFLLSSREDPFPLVALEAAHAKMPIVCFEGSGGMPEFVGTECGFVVPRDDVDAASRAILTLAQNESLRASLGAVACSKVGRLHSSTTTAADVAMVLVNHAQQDRKAPCLNLNDRGPLVSVIVPNYNHASFLSERLESIQRQTIQDLEIILLDDNSRDDSSNILRQFVERDSRAVFHPSETNSGSTFRQWRKGLTMARGKYIWIAESDDAADPAFLEVLLAKFSEFPALSLAYCQSRMIDRWGNDLGLPLEWTSDISFTRWKNDFVEIGRKEIRHSLLRKNTVPNASAVLLKNFQNIHDFVDPSMRLCADWLFWIRLCSRGGIAYSSRPLNLWRLNTSNARTHPPGDLEWLEGSRVLKEASEILLLDSKESEEVLNKFQQQCQAWKRIGQGLPQPEKHDALTATAA